jgi:hypothetical protein
VLRDEHGDVSLILSQKPCPKCGSPLSLVQTRERIALSVVTAMREIDLTAEQLSKLADAIREAPDDVSPHTLADHVPFASRVIAVASKAGDHWVELLVIVVTLFAAWLAYQAAETAHRDAEIAHHDAEIAHDDASAARHGTGRISKEDADRITLEVEQELEKSRRAR